MGVSSQAQKIVNAAEKSGRFIEKITGAVCVLCFALMTAVTILGVFFRYVMQSPFMWTEEAARYALVWMGFMAVSIALRQDRHIKVEALAKIAPPVIVKAFGYLVDILIAFFFVILLKQGWLMTVNNIMTAATMPFSMSWILAAVPVAAALTLIQLVLNTVQKIGSEFIAKSD